MVISVMWRCMVVISVMWWCVVVAQGYTPLHLAAIHGHEDIIELLVTVYSEYSQLLFFKHTFLLLLRDAGADIVRCSPHIFIKSIMDVCVLWLWVRVTLTSSNYDQCLMTTVCLPPSLLQHSVELLSTSFITILMHKTKRHCHICVGNTALGGTVVH